MGNDMEESSDDDLLSNADGDDPPFLAVPVLQ